eukprot:GILJ01003530.1.p1 GENE.GILJ01003530.1~~GILJ01003530.1.p1  ORF type:complete len:613 (+),score=106.44 GILJ01003530.1:52-1890(+)
MADYNASNDVAMGSSNGKPLAMMTEEDRLQSIVTANPLDFDTWSKLISTVETSALTKDRVGDLRRIYEAFLSEFPLCFGFWKKWADLELKEKNFDKVQEIYERGVQAVSKSVDLWAHYCTWFAERSEDLAAIRKLFERAVSEVGLDWSSGLLWDRYIDFEKSQEEWNNVALLYKRVTTTPTAKTDEYMAHFRHFAAFAGRTAEQLVSADESSLLSAETDDLKKKNIMEVREKDFAATQEEVKIRQEYEAQIKRPYFHMKPLDEAQLNNWRNYLTFEEKIGKLDRIFMLYERCLVAAANYTEFWLRYATYLENRGDIEGARRVLHRGSAVYLKRRPNLHLRFAEFEESQGNVQAARDTYDHLISTVAPGLVEAVIKCINFERRQKNLDRAVNLYENALLTTDSKTGPYLVMHYARFCRLFLNSVEKGREVFNGAMERFPENKNIVLAYINFEQQGSDVESKVSAIFERSIGEQSKLSEDDKLELWTLYLEFLSDRANSINDLRQLQVRFRSTYPDPSKKGTLRKRTLESDDSYQGSAAKQARTQQYQAANYPAAAAATGTGADAYSYANYYAGYQTGADAYGQQPAYGGYGAAAAYGAYPQAGAGTYSYYPSQ